MWRDARGVVVRSRFHRAVAAIVVFFAAAGVSVALGGIHATHHVVVDGVRVVEDYRAHQIGSWAAIAVCFISGLIAVRMLAAEVSRIAGLRGSPAAASALRLIVQLVGYLTVIVMVLGLLAVSIQSVLLSGAIGSVVIGLAAQQSLSNIIAGIVLLVARPFVVGDYVTLRAGAIGGQYDGTVTGISLMFTTMQTEEGPMSLPNAAVLNAATGRRQPPT
jgi:small-conductance mechanosensitive channel